MLRPNAQVASTVPLRSSETAEGYNEGMAEERSTSSQPTDALEVLSEEDRVWLAERIVEYEVLLEFLHSN